jgi:hypothetical protein
MLQQRGLNVPRNLSTTTTAASAEDGPQLTLRETFW